MDIRNIFLNYAQTQTRENNYVFSPITFSKVISIIKMGSASRGSRSVN